MGSLWVGELRRAAWELITPRLHLTKGQQIQVRFLGFAKQTGSKWLKNLLVLDVLKTNGCVKFEFGFLGLLS